jgi:negative regulator of flagellin synthesis FlgM
MKINEYSRAGAVNSYRRQSEVTAGGALKHRPVAKDRVQISAEAKELLEAQASGEIERAERIAELRQAVQDGTYHVPANLVADKLLRYLMNDPD